MANWNSLFHEEENRALIPESAVHRFAKILDETFPDKSKQIWDLGCGAGRHTVALANIGYALYASDNAPKAIELTKEWLGRLNLKAMVKQADMTDCPWESVRFHGVIAWDVIHHNNLKNIIKTIDSIYDSLLSGGILLATLKSDKADLFGQGKEIEPNTFILDKGNEAGVLHHYFGEREIRELFDPVRWEFLSLAEQIIRHVERPNGFWKYTPFPFTNWGILVKRKN